MQIIKKFISKSFLAIIIISLTCGCSRNHSSSANPTAKNVLLITATSLRPRSLKCYGTSFVNTPSIDSLAKDGIVFNRAYTVSDNSNLSSRSLLTSMYVKRHSPYIYRGSAADSASSLPGILKKVGYVTGGCTGTMLLDREAFPPAADFDYFFSPGDRKQSFKGADVNLYAAHFLEQNKGKKWFLWVNYFDVSEPFDSPVDYSPASSFCDQEIAYLDHSLGTLLYVLQDLKLRESTMIIFTADHGQMLDEHNLSNEHIGLYEEVLSIPLILDNTGGFPTHKTIDSLVSILDIAPTVLDILKVKSDASFDGKSLLPLIDGQLTSIHECLFAESYLQQASMVRRGDHKLIEYNDDMVSKHMHDSSVRKDNVRIWARKKGMIELFNVASDPNERHSLYEKSSKESQELEQILHKWYSDCAYQAPAKRRAYAVELMVRMKRLGY